ncbi:histidine phosphatase family protein [Streptomyces sp. NRRL F-5126]|uniref:histidine phosphatase family protein n=1 Tax=Streptomyces sp. NRRL F-5126 TaxID=1463857 RepID=UPI00068CC085|nr:histidine phosphatase family protein [Streptomyces sp. NRRL F-5126]
MSEPAGGGSKGTLGRLTAVRHGESTANVVFGRAVAAQDTELIVGGSDAQVPLSPRGLREAEALGRRLADGGPEGRPGLVVCSPYLRARQTWDAMAAVARESGHTLPACTVDERLRDREMGVLELLPPPALRARAPQEAARRKRLGEWFYRPPGGESLADVTLRVRDFLTELRSGGAEGHVLLVAHDSVVVAVRHVLAGIGDPVPADVPVPNASVSWWEDLGPGGAAARLVEFASVSHLTGTGGDREPGTLG